jgi:hypothetical protein
VTFSDAKVAARINSDFVAAWFNRGPGFHNEDYRTERWIFESSMEAYPTRNICTFFLTPEGKVFHYVAGSWAPGLFLAQLDLVLRMRREAFDARMRLKPEGLEEVRKIHAQATVGTDPVEVPAYRGSTHVHTAECARLLQEGRRYLAALHRHWAAVLRLPPLEDVRFSYLYGNSFTEEPRGGAMEVEGRPASSP